MNKTAHVKITSDGCSQHTEILVDGKPLMAKTLHIPKIAAGSGPLVAIVEVYVDEIDIDMPTATIIMKGPKKP